MYMRKVDHSQRNSFYIPARYIIAMFLIFIEVLAVIGVVVVLSWYVPYFFYTTIFVQLVCALSIINSNDNPDYKVPWMFFVLIVPIVGFMLFFIFYHRNMSKHQFRRITKLMGRRNVDNEKIQNKCCKECDYAYSQANLLCNLSNTNLYGNTSIKYFSCGEDMLDNYLQDLKTAKKFIIIDYFIISLGTVWNSILQVLKHKADEGVEVRVIYDDIGCMTKLPGNYYKILNSYGIKATTFGRLRGQANSEFNNRNHRKITIIDGIIAYTGGINLADEYFNITHPYGYWKDCAIRLVGDAVNELTRLCLLDLSMANKNEQLVFENYYTNTKAKGSGYCVPFGDGPKPVYQRNVSKTLIMTMLSQAKDYVYITTPYLIIDNEMTQSIENASLRGVDVRIITPHIPDKRIPFGFTRSFYDRLIKSGVKIYEFEPGFIHAKSYISDDQIALIGTINLDYRSLVHHYENGVWMYDKKVVADIKKDFLHTQQLSIACPYVKYHSNIIKKIFRAIIYVFAPLF